MVEVLSLHIDSVPDHPLITNSTPSWLVEGTNTLERQIVEYMSTPQFLSGDPSAIRELIIMTGQYVQSVELERITWEAFILNLKKNPVGHPTLQT